MMNQAQHPKELLELAIVICPFIVKHMVTRHDQSILITMADPVSFFRTFSSHFFFSPIAFIHTAHSLRNNFFTSTIFSHIHCTQEMSINVLPPSSLHIHQTYLQNSPILMFLISCHLYHIALSCISIHRICIDFDCTISSDSHKYLSNF